MGSAVAVAGPQSATPATAGPPPVADKPLSTEQALAKARLTRTAVPVPAATTATDTLTANPNGTLTSNRTVVPVRKQVNGVWTPVDATLHVNTDGSLSPKVSTSDLKLSGGGDRALARMARQGTTLGLDLAFALPAPTLSGATATYANVLPDVDLKVTANDQGGFSEVLVVRTAAAAANPAVRRLAMPVTTSGLTVSADAAGNLQAVDRIGRAVFTANAPTMWDAAVSSASASAMADGTKAADAAGGPPAASSAAGPGRAAHSAPIGVDITKNTLTLTPDAKLLNAADTVYPVYIDPSWNPSASAYATVTSSFSSTKYWNSTPDPDGHLQAGHNSSIHSRTLLNFPINISALSGASISEAKIFLFEVYSSDCTARTTNIYAPSTTLTAGNANWTSWDAVGWGNAVGSVSTQTGYSSCPNGAGVAADVTGAVIGAVNAGKSVQTFGLRTANENDLFNYKEFLATGSSAPSMSIVYNHTPNVPSGLSTSPTTNCTGTTTTVGDGLVSLYAPVSDADGGNLGVAFKIWRTSDGQVQKTSDPNVLTAASGTTAVLQVDSATLRAASGGGTTVTKFSWAVYVTDYSANSGTSAWSTTCSFNFDPTRPGAPAVNEVQGAAMGQPITIPVSKPADGTVPTSYTYQLNGAAPQQAPATNGDASITITPNRFTNVLTITGLSAGNNIGDTKSLVFNASPPSTPRVDQDLTGDGSADLVAAGGANGLPAGVWLAPGRRTGTLIPAAADIGVNGAAVNNVPADFDGAQIITGRFAGSPLQDLGAYYPATGKFTVIRQNGDGTPTPNAKLSGVTNKKSLSADELGYTPLQIANAGNASGQTTAYPDLIAIAGSATDGYYLDYYAEQAGGGVTNYSFPSAVANPTPTGGADWNNWTISSALTSSGTWLFLWNKTTGGLYLWKNLTFDTSALTIAYTQYTLAVTGWNTGAGITLRAADADRNDIPDLWSIDAVGGVTPWLVSGLSGTTGVLTARPAQSLTTTAHTWSLSDDDSGGTVTTAADTSGGLNVTAAGNAKWNTGDLYSPDVLLDGSATLSTASAAVTTDQSFTLSVWVKPASNNHAVMLSQENGGFWLYIDTDHSWRFAMLRADHATWDVAASAPNAVNVGVWMHLTASFQKTTNTISLAIDDQTVAIANHSSTWTDIGKFRIGSGLENGSPAYFFSGQVASVETRGSLLNPVTTGTLGSDHNVSGNLDNVIGNVDMTRQGMTDWAGWGQSSATSSDHKANAGGEISYPTANGASKTRSSGGATLTWTNGTPVASATNAGNGVAVTGLGSDLQFTVPARTTLRVLRVYAVAKHTTGILTATLSDGSGGYISNTLSSPAGTATGVFTIAFRSPLPNQVLTVTWQASTFTDPASSVALQGATLQQSQFDTSLETGQPQLTWTSTVDTGAWPHGGLANVTGVCCSLTGPEALRTNAGPAHSLGDGGQIMYSGYDTSTASSYAYTKAIDLTGANVTVKAGTTLSYWIFPQSAANSGNLANGTNSTCVAIDLIYGTSNNLRDGTAVEQHGRSVHPRSACNNLTLDTWNFVTIDIGAVSNGQPISSINIGYDQAANLGGYRGFIDEITITG
ncbi:LamG-like jellyroll fold domain-containing protein [Dactylosporangium sp. NPDC051541]|uniref:LamG-like jellyroll fold domain-containing protein n=1 Tax=Dactylosporangium sp. NPDC051541 TaxID=3363977 RepID=UPI003797F4DF